MYYIRILISGWGQWVVGSGWIIGLPICVHTFRSKTIKFERRNIHGGRSQLDDDFRGYQLISHPDGGYHLAKKKTIPPCSGRQCL